MIEFLSEQNLSFEADVDVSLLLMRGDQIVGCGSVAGEIRKCLAAAPELRGMGSVFRLVSELLARLQTRGSHHAFVFTRPRRFVVHRSRIP